MAYIGTPPVDRFVASKAASVHSGDGSTTAFILDHAVGSDEDILVSVDGVIQEPSVAYAVSNGTTLTFTAAPSSNSGNNIFVYYLFRTVGTVSHPSNNALSATSGTFTGDVTIGDASAADKKILFDGNAQDFHIGLDDSADSLTIGLGSTLGTTSHMVFDSTGAITKPLQPAFLAKPSTAQNNLTNNPSGVDLLFATEVFDQNADYNNSNYTFTAPVTGKYNLFAHAYLYNLDGDANVIYITLATSNRSIYGIIDPNFGQDNEYWTLTVSMIFDMDANDTAKVTWLQSGGTAQTSLQPSSHFGGHLVA
jgi:hypothetical protein